MLRTKIATSQSKNVVKIYVYNKVFSGPGRMEDGVCNAVCSLVTSLCSCDFFVMSLN